MQNTVDSMIAALRVSVSAKNDAELARLIGVDQSTISSWRARGRLPQRFAKMIDGSAAMPSGKPPEFWGELQECAHVVALIRYTLIRADVALSSNVDLAISAFMDIVPFWLVMHRAVHEIQLKMEALNVDVQTAQILLMQEDLRNPKAAADRIAKQVAEDSTDNPWLDTRMLKST